MVETQSLTIANLIRTEVAAAEAYEQALDAIAAGPLADELHQVYAEHREAANALRQHLRMQGTEPQDAAPYRPSSRLRAASDARATLSLDRIAEELKALRKLEAAAATEYRSAAEAEDLPLETRALLRSMLLPQTEAHVAMLDRLLNV